MTTLEERIARLEARQDNVEHWLTSIDEKVDRLLALANFGKGSLATLLKLGAGVAALSGLGIWLLQSVRWH